MLRVCHGASASGYCQVRTCGASNAGVQIRFPFVLPDDAVNRGCYTDYPELVFTCMDQLLYLNFTANITYSYDSFKVVNIDYWEQTLSLVPSLGDATCQDFIPSRFGGLNITNSTTLLLDCPQNIYESCTRAPPSLDDVCSNNATGVPDVGYRRWVCPMTLSNFSDAEFSSCHLAPENPTTSSELNSSRIVGSTTLVLQFEGDRSMFTASESISVVFVMDVCFTFVVRSCGRQLFC